MSYDMSWDRMVFRRWAMHYEGYDDIGKGAWNGVGGSSACINANVAF